jgi:hypothetical protein
MSQAKITSTGVTIDVRFFQAIVGATVLLSFVGTFWALYVYGGDGLLERFDHFIR